MCTHFLDFGHSLIYQVKLFDFLDCVGWAHCEDILVCHLHKIVHATREDTLPKFRHFEEFWESVAGQLPQLYRQLGTAALDRDTLVGEVLDGDREESLQAVLAAIQAGASRTSIVDALSVAACERILRFYVDLDGDPTIQNNWLDVIHVFTFAHALRHTVERFRDPLVLRALLFAARFINASQTMDAAVRVPNGSIGDPKDFVRDAWNTIVTDRLTRPLVGRHLIKMLVAAQEESAALGDCRPLWAVQRLLTSPGQERNVARLTHEAIRLVRDSKVPRTGW